jgi:hypothetical protein
MYARKWLTKNVRATPKDRESMNANIILEQAKDTFVYGSVE